MPEEAVKHQGLAGASGYDGIPSKGNLPKKRVFGWVVAIIAVVAGIFGGHSGTNAAVLITVVATITTGPAGFFVGVDLYTISGGAPFLRDSSFRFERRSSRAHRYGPLNKSPTVTDAALDRCEN
jgi:hypothetical protein